MTALSTDAPSLLELTTITAAYARQVVTRDVSISVPEKSIVALLGPNGAGKTTLLRIAAGLMRPQEGAVIMSGLDVTHLSPNGRAKKGMCLVPEGRGIFRSLSVADNLRLQSPPWKTGKRAAEERVAHALEIFPDLKQRLRQSAGTLSGGQQQMVALARIYMAEPSLVLLDEVSMGLAPLVVEQIFQALEQLAATGIALLLVEQYVHRALQMCDYVYLLNTGTITYAGPPAGLDTDEVTRGYLGVAP